MDNDKCTPCLNKCMQQHAQFDQFCMNKCHSECGFFEMQQLDAQSDCLNLCMQTTFSPYAGEICMTECAPDKFHKSSELMDLYTAPQVPHKYQGQIKHVKEAIKDASNTFKKTAAAVKKGDYAAAMKDVQAGAKTLKKDAGHLKSDWNADKKQLQKYGVNVPQHRLALQNDFAVDYSYGTIP